MAPYPVEERRVLGALLHGRHWTAEYTICGEAAIRLISVRRSREKGLRCMKRRGLATSAKEFDRRFDAGEDVHDLIDTEKAKVIRRGRRVRLTIDVAESLVNELDEIRQKIGVERGALIKVWLHERVMQEKATK